MPINYIVGERVNPQKPDEPNKFYAIQKSEGDVKFREYSDKISKISTLSPIDIKGGNLIKIIGECKSGDMVSIEKYFSIIIISPYDGDEVFIMASP